MAFDREAWSRNVIDGVRDDIGDRYFGGPKEVLRTIVQSLKLLLFWSFGGRPTRPEPLRSISGVELWAIYTWFDDHKYEAVLGEYER